MSMCLVEMVIRISYSLEVRTSFSMEKKVSSNLLENVN